MLEVVHSFHRSATHTLEGKRAPHMHSKGQTCLNSEDTEAWEDTNIDLELAVALVEVFLLTLIVCTRIIRKVTQVLNKIQDLRLNRISHT